MNAREIVGSVLIVLAAAFTVCLTAVMVRRIRAVVLRETYEKVFRCELAACALFLLLALDVRFGLLGGRVPGRLLRGLVWLAAAVLLFFLGRVALGGLLRTDGAAENVLVLGLALENGRPTGDLLARLDTAEQYWREHPGVTLILTGGNPDGAGKTEAAVMRDILVGRGVPEERLRLEDRAETTGENFRNAAEMIDPGAPTVVITSNYHMDRAVRTAKRAGFSQVLRRPAPSSVFAFGANAMWEAAMELNECTLKRPGPGRKEPQT